MAIRQWLASRFVWRNVLDGAFGASFFDTDGNTVIPYFQYSIGRYESGFLLRFNKEPTARQFLNEIFRKGTIYLDKGLGPYLNFHYEAYEDKEVFLQFLKDAVKIYGSQPLDIKKRLTVELVSEWITRKEEQVKREASMDFKEDLSSIIRQAIEENLPLTGGSQEQTDHLVNRFESLLLDSAVLLPKASVAFERPSPHLDRKLIVFFKILAEMGYKDKNGQVEKLFTEFTQADIASILKLHFNSFKKHQPNTIVKNISTASDFLKKSPAKAALEKALEDFFFE